MKKIAMGILLISVVVANTVMYKYNSYETTHETKQAKVFGKYHNPFDITYATNVYDGSRFICLYGKSVYTNLNANETIQLNYEVKIDPKTGEIQDKKIKNVTSENGNVLDVFAARNQ